MTRYLAQRVGQALLAILAALLIVFCLVRLTGDPAELMSPPDATKDQVDQLRHNLGLDGSIFTQFGHFIADAVKGDFGTSLRTHQSALSTVFDRLPATLELGLVSFVVTFLIAVPIGVYAAAHQGSRFDRWSRVAMAVAQAIPAFWLGAMLVLVFSVQLGWLPTSGRGGWQHMVMPVITLSLFSVAGLARLTRSAVLETLRTEYVKFARVKGASEAKVLWVHGFRNAFLPILTLTALLLLNTLSGSVIVETIFSWPGVGQLAITSVSSRDFPVVQAVVLMLAVAYTFGNMLVDIAYGYLNPQIRLG